MKKHLRRWLAACCSAVLLLTGASALTPEQAVELLEEYYVDEVPEGLEQIQDLNELVASLGDPYTFYMNAEEYRSFLESVNGVSQVGIGVSVSFTAEGIYINSTLPGSAAEEAGLVAGDVIIAIDGASCVPAQESDVTRISGEEGTVVSITVRRADDALRTFAITRRSFTAPMVSTSLLDNGVGYIDCDSFSMEAGEQFEAGIGEYDAKTTLWLVELRGNPGGVTQSAVTAAGAFTGPGALVYFRDGQGTYYRYLHRGAYLTGDPVIVLTNFNSASASEVFASAIKDYGAGIVVGGRTYGKGVAQEVLDETTHPELFDGDGLKVTTYRFFSGMGNTTDSIGVFPTLMVGDLFVNAVVTMFQVEEPTDPRGWLNLELGGWNFYVDAAAAKEAEGGQAALAELFAALAPQMPVKVWKEGRWVRLEPKLAAEHLGLEYQSRWFTDVADSDYEKELNALATYGVLRGGGDGTFRPKETLNRAQLCALLAQTLNLTATGPSPFSDVSDDRWYADSITAMCEMGLVQGKGDGTFAPDDLLTQKELTVVLGRLAEFLNANCYDVMDTITAGELASEELSGWAEWSKSYAWMLGMAFTDQAGERVSLLHESLDQIDPDAPVLREEAGAALYRILHELGMLTY